MNTTYIFIPFRFKQECFQSLVGELQASGDWKPAADEIKYMLKYVSEKIDSKSPRCQCFHFELRSVARLRYGLGTEKVWYHMAEPHTFHGQSSDFPFRIQSVQLFCFRTSVGILAFQCSFAENRDPLWISTALYHLKNVSAESIICEEAGKNNFLKLAGDILRKTLSKELYVRVEAEFFYHANAGTERANVLSYVEVELQEDYRQELYYLRHCYDENYQYVYVPEVEQREVFYASRTVAWGISPEAAVCLPCPERDRENFIQTKLCRNFQTQYLFMYIFLLHQKYVLYLFLMKISSETYESLEALEEYRRQLYEFETDFVYPCVSEVPQYQNLYEKMMEAFSLKEMFEDVREPLEALGEARKAAEEEEQKKREQSLNQALNTLSLLAVFSALVDSFDYIGEFFPEIFGAGTDVVRTLQVFFTVVILCILIHVLILNVRFKGSGSKPKHKQTEKKRKWKL